MDFGIKGKAAIVCGASRGLGRACAEALAGEGVRLIVCSRHFDRIFQTARVIAETYGTTVVPIAADLSQPDSPDKLVRETINKFGAVDILINNTGGPPAGKLEELDDGDWEQAFHLTLMSAVRMTRAVLPVMTKNGWGRVVNLASISVKQPIPTLILSNSLRAAVVGMAKTLSSQIAEKGVTINTIATGSFDTERLQSLFKNQAKKTGLTPQEAEAKLAATIPMGRIGKPEELAWLAAFLASERASYITGATIQVDGGSYAGLM